MSALPRLSLVTPTFNQAATLRETIESVLAQDYPNLDYQVIDAASPDGTIDILRAYERDPRFRWMSEPDRGQSDAINKGLARATGEVFNWINSDDYLEPGALQLVAETFRQNPAARIVSGRTAEFRGQPAEIFNHISLPLRATPEATITVGIFCQPSTWWRTDIFRALGGVDSSLHYVMDWDLWVRYLALHGQKNVLLLDQVLAHFRHHPDAKTAANPSRFYAEARTVFRDLLHAAHAPPDYLEQELEIDADATNSPSREILLGPNFNPSRYLGAYADRMVRTYRRKNPPLSKKWLRQAISRGLTPWRLKMALRLMFH